MKKLYRKIDLLVKKIGSYHVALYAANASFFIILSLFPTVMLIVSILPYIGFSDNDLLSAIMGIVPSVFEPLLARIIHDMSSNTTTALISISALTAVWSSSRGVYYIHQGINAIYQVREKRNYFLRRLLCMFYMVLFLIALVLTLVIHGFGQEVAAFCESKNVPILRLFAKLLQFRELIVFGLLTMFFTAVFCVFPSRRVRIREAIPGAVLAALGWLIFTYGFSFYVREFNSYSVLYGSISVIAVAMLWLYICISIIFYGSVTNLWLEGYRQSRAEQKAVQ